jgi:hypothetical protein
MRLHREKIENATSHIQDHLSSSNTTTQYSSRTKHRANAFNGAFQQLHARTIDRRREEAKVRKDNDRLFDRLVSIQSPLNKQNMAKDYTKNRNQ